MLGGFARPSNWVCYCTVDCCRRTGYELWCGGLQSACAHGLHHADQDRTRCDHHPLCAKSRRCAGGQPAPQPKRPWLQLLLLSKQSPLDEPYSHPSENSTLAGVTAMTSIIGRVPINGRVTDPMQFKALIGRDNLAANGWELPEDLAGMVVTGIAIGDMALSCSEGKVRSITFVFNDGSIRTRLLPPQWILSIYRQLVCL